jgi:hypothetical protein
MHRAPKIAQRIALVLLASTSAGAQRTAQPANQVDVIQRDANRRVDIVVDGKPFTSYVWPTSLMKPTLFPLRSATGAIVTRGYPLEPRGGERVDHPHHAGLWFNYGDVNGLDFWNNSTEIKAADAPKMGTVVHKAVRSVASGKGEGSLVVTTEWVDHQGKTLLKEDVLFIFRAGSDFRSVDRITTLTALVDSVVFRDNKEGVVGMRVARALELPSNTPDTFTDASGRPTTVPRLDNTGVTGTYLSAEGKVNDDVWGTRARWTTLSGVIERDTVTVAMFDHPKNPGFPTYWHARGYGLFAANPLGQKIFSNGKQELNFTLKNGQSQTFRHQVMILNGTRSASQIEPYYVAFTR